MYSAKFNVWFYETDMMGIAHHSNHFRWFENARVEYLRHIGITLGSMMDEDIVFPIMNVSCHYNEPARFDDVIRIETYLTKLTRAQWYLNTVWCVMQMMCCLLLGKLRMLL